MANNKIIYGDEVLIDLTEDSVTESKVLAGSTFHKANGEIVTGSIETYQGENTPVTTTPRMTRTAPTGTMSTSQTTSQMTLKE